MAQNPQLYDPAGTYVPPVTKAWTTTGNTDLVTDEGVESATQVIIMNTSAYNGRWYISNITPTTFATNAQTGVITETPGSFTVTSSNSESATTTTYKYLLV